MWRVFYRFRFPSLFSEGGQRLGDLWTDLTHNVTGPSDKHVYRAFVKRFAEKLLVCYWWLCNCQTGAAGIFVRALWVFVISFPAFRASEFTKIAKRTIVFVALIPSHDLRCSQAMFRYNSQRVKVFFFAPEKRWGEVSLGFIYARTTKPSAY